MSTGDVSVEAGYDGHTAWARNLAAPVRDFLSTESGGAGLMVVATIVALVWANSPWRHSYNSLWATKLAIQIGGGGISATLRVWVNQGLMTLFFLVVGLEAKRQLDLGELRERRRLAVPVFAAIGGMLVPALIYLAWNAGTHEARDWGAAISTDTAFALSVVGLLAPRSATRMRVFLLSLAVVDDLTALLVIAFVYTEHVSIVPLAIAIGLFGLLLALRWFPGAVGRSRSGSGSGSGWRCSSPGSTRSSRDSPWDSPPAPTHRRVRSSSAPSSSPGPSASSRRRRSRGRRSEACCPRSRPTSGSSTSCTRGRATSIVPLFALANAGVHLTGPLLSAAFSSPVTLGIITGYLAGKPIGVVAGSWLASRPQLRGPRAPVSAPVLLAGGVFAGVGFTVSLLVSSLAFNGQLLAEAKIGTLCTLILAPALAWLVMQVIRRIPADLRARQIAGTAEDILDLAVDVDPDRDHIRGAEDAPVTIVEYGDFECPFCGQAEQVIRELLAETGYDVRYVWRHLPLNDVHPYAQLAAEAIRGGSRAGAVLGHV